MTAAPPDGHKNIEALEAVRQFQRKKLSCPEWDLNPRSPAYVAGVLPPRQLSRLGTNSGNGTQINCTYTVCTCYVYTYTATNE